MKIEPLQKARDKLIILLHIIRKGDEIRLQTYKVPTPFRPNQKHSYPVITRVMAYQQQT